MISRPERVETRCRQYLLGALTRILRLVLFISCGNPPYRWTGTFVPVTLEPTHRACATEVRENARYERLGHWPCFGEW